MFRTTERTTETGPQRAIGGGNAGGTPQTGVDDYLRPASTDKYLRPDGTSFYKRPN